LAHGRISPAINLEKTQKGDIRYFKLSTEDARSDIPDDLKDTIFRRMLRGTLRVKCIGLGLYLVKSLADSYHGKVRVEGRVKGDHTKGARFVVMLPAV
jgi:nitrogen-specific signal transduction histidine kinase